VQPGKVGEGVRKLGSGEVFVQPDAAVAAKRTPGFGECLGGERENPLGVRQELLTRPGRGDARRRSVQQRTADGALEFAHLLAERGLGMAERRRGSADAARPHGSDERPQQRDLKIPGHKNRLWRDRQAVSRGLVASALSVVAYGTVLWAQSRAPLAVIAAIRETSVIFAALIGMVFLRERFGTRRVAAAALIAAGIVLITA
jgi:multidrug transporter EmrE-like cation transporter